MKTRQIKDLIISSRGETTATSSSASAFFDSRINAGSRHCLQVGVLLGALASIIPVITHAQAPQWITGQDADRVVGQADFDTADAGADASSFEEPADVAIDPTTGKVFVLDRNNSRILRFSSSGIAVDGGAAEAVFGADDLDTPELGCTASRFNRPEGIFVDHAGRLWVAEFQNNRVLRFDNASFKPSGASADGVLGQTLFTTNAFARTASGMHAPFDITGDEGGTIWVSDNFNARVLRFDGAAAKAHGAPADAVLGQPDFTTLNTGDGTGQLVFPRGIAVSDDGRLFVSDSTNRRIHRYDSPTVSNGVVPPDAVIGQVAADQSVFFGHALNAVPSPSGLAYSAVNDTLYISDDFSNRIVVIEGVSSKSGLVDATALLGQTADGLSSVGLARNRLNIPARLGVDSHNRLYVADSANNRVLRFSPSSLDGKSDFRVDLTIGKRPTGQGGNDLYNTTGSGQSQTVVTRNRRAATCYFSAQNDGLLNTNCSMRGSRGSRFFRVTYRSITAPLGNVTGAMIAGTTTGALNTNAGHRFRIDLTSSSKRKKPKKAFRSLITGSDPLRQTMDVVAVTAVAR